MSAPERFDAIVIGAGAGGLTVALGLARLGRLVALIEADAVGGDCTNVGCIPSKTLLHLARGLEARGLRSGDADWPAAAAAVLDRVRAKRDALRVRETRELAETANLTLVRGHARLAGERRVLVAPPSGPQAFDPTLEERVLAANTIVLATGARAVQPDVPGLPTERAATNASLFDLHEPPGHLVVVGGGPIGVEMATAFARLGSRVTLVEAAARLLPGVPAAAGEAVGAALRQRGVAVHLAHRASAYTPHHDTGVLHLTGADGTVRDVADVDRVLFAVGRRPNVEGMGLAALGVRVRPGGIVTDRAHRTARRGVYAIGDVTERAKHTHAANAQGRRLVRHLTLPWLPLVPEGDYPAAVFAEPEVAHVGPSPEGLRRRYPAALTVTHRIDLASLDRGYVEDVAAGFVEVTAMRFSGRVLTATVVGPHAAELVQLLTWLQRRGGSLWQLSRHVVAYPALAEALKKVADAFVFATLPALPRELAAYLLHRWRRPPRTAPDGTTAPATPDR